MNKSAVMSLCVALLALLVSAQAASATITISNVTKSFDPLNCEVTISWTTSEATDTNLVKWDNASCQQGPTYPYVEYESGGSSTSHSVTFSVVDATGIKIAFVIESSNSTDSGSTTCGPTKSGPCIGS
jgi:hypothetical protein